MPAETHPQTKALIKLYSKLNSSVAPLRLHKKTPTQKPVHNGQWNNSPSFPDVGLIGLNIEPKTKIKVRPYAVKINQINSMNHLYSINGTNSVRSHVWS